MNLRDSHRQYATGMLRQFGQFIDVTGYIVAVKHCLFTALGQPVYQSIDLRRGRRLADEVAAFGADHGGAAGPGEFQQHIREGAQAVADAVVVGHGRNHPHDVLAQVEQLAGFGVGLT